MQTREVQQSEWHEFLDNFSRKHKGTLVALEILGPKIGAQTEETGLALQGITAYRDQAARETITIMLGASADDHITHSISRPTQVSLGQSNERADFALAIKAEDGSTALLRFQAKALQEVADADAT